MRVISFLGFSLVCFAALAGEPAPLKLVQTIPLPGVKGRFDHIAVDSRGHRLFVAALGNNTLEVVDVAAGKRLRSVPGMSKPTGVLFLPKPNQILVANGGAGELTSLDGANYNVSHRLADLPDADNFRFDSTTQLAWLGYGDGALAAVDASGPKLVTAIKLPNHPESFQ